MCPSMRSFIDLTLFALVTSIMIHQTKTTSNHLGVSCSNTTTFANNSAFEANLNTLFRSLNSNATNNPTGFYQVTVENPTSEAIYGQYMCRGDQNRSACHDCVTTATTKDLPKKMCPNRKRAITWYDECMVRYANESFINQMALDPSIVYWSEQSILGNASQFDEILRSMMSNVIAVQAAEGGSSKKFATALANVSIPIPQTIYGLGQCTPDLSVSDCYRCLSSAFSRMRNDTQGGRCLAPSCVVRYETYAFFDLSSLPPPSPPLHNASIALPRTSPSTRRGKKQVLVLSIIAAAVLVITAALLLVICISLLRRKSRKMGAIPAQKGHSDLSVDSLQYDLVSLRIATNDFSDENKLGQGGFGGVYKGTLSNGQEVAVKRLSASSSQGIQEFKSEVLLVAKLQHRNLVRLLGFCVTDEEKLLVYEYVPNKSLDSFLFDHKCETRLDWGSRYNIIRGIARGMLYLHHDSQLRIIHRDLKASNILLDLDMNPKIADFGTARIFGVDQSQNNYTNKVVGTYGYMAPEYVMHGNFSIKSDAYSFGVLVLEIVTGRKICCVNRSTGDEDLLSYVWKNWRNGTPIDCVDQVVRDACSNVEAMRCIHIALLCVQESVEDRPSMVTVVLSLDSLTVTLPMPEPPSFRARTGGFGSRFSTEICSNEPSVK